MLEWFKKWNERRAIKDFRKELHQLRLDLLESGMSHDHIAEVFLVIAGELPVSRLEQIWEEYDAEVKSK